MKPSPAVAAAVAVLVVSSVVLAAYMLGAFSSEESTIDGAIVISESESEMRIWCYSPQAEIVIEDFDGTVIFDNCICEPRIAGGADTEQIGNNSYRFQATGGEFRATIEPPLKDGFAFALMGDSQGHNDILSAILSEIAEAEDCDFALLCGDLTPSGRASEFVAFQETLNESAVPVYLTAGNHDVKTNGGDEYEKRFGPAEYSFEYCEVQFAIVDSSDLNVTFEQIEWMQREFEDATKRVMMTHVPPYDPFGDNHTLWPESCDRVLSFIEQGGVDAVLSGHIHAFNHTTIGSADMVISGGAGATLVDGEHHYAVVTVDELNSFDIDKFDVTPDIQPTSILTVVGRDGTTCNYTFEDLFAMDIKEGESSFENYFGNIGGNGYYTGVAICDLVELAGGMMEGDVLRVTAMDSYYQDFGYLNVYPNETWLELQGTMLLALTIDSITAPDWEEGPKLVMLAPDGLYSNSDCEETSYEGQGYSIYPSAGARWVKNTATIQVIPCE